MKKFFLAATLFAASTFSVFAQDEATEESRRPVAGNAMFSFGIQGLQALPILDASAGQTNTLLFRYYVADGLAARVGLSYERDGSTTTDIVAGSEIEDKNSSSMFMLSLGAQKSLGTSSRVEPYIGGDLVFGRGGSSSFSRSEVINQADAGGTPVGTFSQTETKDISTMAIGLVPTVGFNYYFAKNFAVGAEFGWGYIYTRASGGTSETSGTGFSPISSTSDLVQRGGSFTNTGSGSIIVSVFF